MAEALDQLDVGRFHVQHLLRMILAWVIFAATQESTPFQGVDTDILHHYNQVLTDGLVRANPEDA